MVEITALLRNTGIIHAWDVPVKLRVKGATHTTGSIDMPGEVSVNLTFNYRVPSDQEYIAPYHIDVIVDPHDYYPEQNNDNNLMVDEFHVFPANWAYPSPALVGESVHFVGLGTYDGYAWTSDIDGEFYNGTEQEIDNSTLGPGEHTLHLRVLDNDGKWKGKGTPFTLLVHNSPVASIDSVSPGIAIFNETVIFSGSGTDDGLIVRYSWRSSIDGELYNGSLQKFNLTDISIGEHTIFLKVLDDQNAWSEEVNTTLLVHTVPVASIESISPDPVSEMEVITFTGNGTDDGTIARYSWRSSIDGGLYNDSDAVFTFSDLSPGTHIIYFKVMDNHGAWSAEVNTTIPERSKTGRTRFESVHTTVRTIPEYLYGNCMSRIRKMTRHRPTTMTTNS